MNVSIYVTNIAQLHTECILKWKQSPIKITQSDLLKIVQENHAFNYQLWHAEDRARREDLGFEFVYRAKREIDHYNQERNNRMESIDLWLFNNLNPSLDINCPVHSETPGMIIDRLSILALKAYHMNIERQREGTSTDHKQNCHKKCQVIHAQQQILQQCLHQLLLEIGKKTRTFKVYNQFKMYNDPTLNPQLYSHST